MRVEAQFEVLPRGSAKASMFGRSDTTDLAVAYGIAATFDYALTSYLSIGASPRLILNIIADPAGDDTADHEIDLRASLRVHHAVASGLELHASVSPGYVILSSSTVGVDAATGFAIGGAAGLAYSVGPRMFVSGEVGYQRAFTSTTIQMGAPPFKSDLDVSYLHVGIGAGMRF